MSNDACYQLSQTYALFITKEVLKAAAAHIFDDMRQTLSQHIASAPAPGCEGQAAKMMELLSDVECRYYNNFDLNEVFAEVIER